MGCYLSCYNYKILKKYDNFGKNNIELIKINNNQYIKKKIKTKNRLIKEINILKTIKSDRVNKIHKYVIKKNKYFIYYNYINGCDLFEFYMKNDNYNEFFLIKILNEMAKCIKDIHDHGIVHLDIKLENFICVEYNAFNIKLIDFEFSKFVGNQNEKILYSIGTRPNIAPEIIIHKIVNLKCDVWSLASSFYGFITGENLLPQENYDKNFFNKNISKYKKKRIDKLKNNYSNNFCNLFENMLELDYKKRYTINQVINHQIFNT